MELVCKGDNLSLDQVIQIAKKQVVQCSAHNKQEQMKKKQKEKTLKQLIDTKTFVEPIVAVIKGIVNYRPNINKNDDLIMEQIERRLVALIDSEITMKECMDFITISRSLISSFPVSVWKRLSSYQKMDKEQLYLFGKFWSIFSQTLLLYEKIGITKMQALTVAKRKELIDTVTDIETLNAYILSVGPIQPLDVLNTILEFHGLSYRAPYGTAARDLFLELFIKSEGDVDEMIKNCCRFNTKGISTLEIWLNNNKDLVKKLYEVACFSVAFNRDPMSLFMNPHLFCEDHGVKTHRFPKYNGNRTNPIVAELTKEIKHNGNKIVAVSVMNIMLIPITDKTIFDRVREFEKLYFGRILIVCALGMHVPTSFKSDLLIVDRTMFKSIFKN